MFQRNYDNLPNLAIVFPGLELIYLLGNVFLILRACIPFVNDLVNLSVNSRCYDPYMDREQRNKILLRSTEAI